MIVSSSCSEYHAHSISVKCISVLKFAHHRWSACSATCDTGYSFRSRKIAVTPNECGAPLEGDEQEFKKCNTQGCDEVVVDCTFSEWSDFGDCSCECNGIKDRTRRIVTYSQGGGKLCEGSLKEVRPCNRPGHGGANCGTVKVDCDLSEWGISNSFIIFLVSTQGGVFECY